MCHKNLDDTHDNVFPKFKITKEEERVIRKAIKSYKINKFKNQVIRDGKQRWSSEQYLEKYPDYFEEHGKNKLRSKGKSPGEILDDYFVKIGKPTDCKRWYNLARCVIAIGEYE